jgi:hypothetical protein
MSQAQMAFERADMNSLIDKRREQARARAAPQAQDKCGPAAGEASTRVAGPQALLG